MTAVETTVPLFKVFMAPEASERVKTVLESGFITQGPVVEALVPQVLVVDFKVPLGGGDEAP